MDTYVALLRGINVGGKNKIKMIDLQANFEAMGFTAVQTYIQSGNVLFKSELKQNDIRTIIGKKLKKEFGKEIPVLVKKLQEMKRIIKVIPPNWQNDSTQRSDVAYLFPEADSIKTIDELPIKKEFLDIRYVKGAIYWNINRKNYNKSHLNKIISHRLYQFMTVRNVNTTRKIYDLMNGLK